MKKYISPIIDFEVIECEGIMDIATQSPFTTEHANEINLDWNFGTQNGMKF